MRPSSLAVALLAVLVVATSLWFVTRPPRGAEDYRERAAETAESLRSHVQSTRLWVGTLARDRALRPSAEVAFREAEDDATANASAFAGYAVPPGGLGARSELMALASDVTDALAAVRIAAQADRWSRLPSTAEPLATLSRRLKDFADKART